MDYQDTLTYLYNSVPMFQQVGGSAYKEGLENTLTLDAHFEHPHRSFRSIHVAGTNGKGSCSHTLAAILQEAGYRVGLYTSPHLVDFRERIRINGQPIPEEYVIRFVEQERGFFEPLHPSFFELTTAMAFRYFADEKVDVAVIEVGLGGRLDCTNIIRPDVCIITNISFDHTQFLGDTLAKIAGEKAGIMVPGVPVIYDGNDPDAAGVMREHAEKLGCPYYELKREDTEIHKITKDGIRFSLKDETYGDTVFDIPFIARYQVMNAALAVKTIQVLENQIPVSLEALKAGMAKTRWQGRMETVLPGVIVDGAHNEDGVEKFVETAEHFQKEIPLTLLFSAVDDKDYTDMIRTICSRIRFRHVIVTQVGGYRKVPVEELAEIFREDGVPEVEAIEDVPAAFERAAKEKGEDGMLFCVGSLYLVGEIKAVIRRKKL